jgi:hypothetical protein
MHVPSEAAPSGATAQGAGLNARFNRHMRVVLGAVVLVMGTATLFAGPGVARWRVSLHFSAEDLAAKSGLRYRRVRRTRWAAYAINEAIAGFWIYLAVRLLTS